MIKSIINKLCCWCTDYPSDEPCCWCNDDEDFDNE